MIPSGASVDGASKSNWWFGSSGESVGSDGPAVVDPESSTIVVVVVDDAGDVVVVVVVENGGEADVLARAVGVSIGVGDTVGGTVDALSSSLVHAVTTSEAPHTTATRQYERHAARKRTARDMVESA
jgi:hypothetical protein